MSSIPAIVWLLAAWFVCSALTNLWLSVPNKDGAYKYEQYFRGLSSKGQVRAIAASILFGPLAIVVFGFVACMGSVALIIKPDLSPYAKSDESES